MQTTVNLPASWVGQAGHPLGLPAKVLDPRPGAVVVHTVV
jgi:hypothetical protein